jgi:hypothetical protein
MTYPQPYGNNKHPEDTVPYGEIGNRSHESKVQQTHSLMAHPRSFASDIHEPAPSDHLFRTRVP